MGKVRFFILIGQLWARRDGCNRLRAACAGAIQCVLMIGQLNGLGLGAEGAVAAIK